MRKPSPSPSPSATSSSSAAGKKTPCCVKVGLKRGPWTPEEDEVLSSYIRREGEGRWRTLPKRSGLLRCGKSCRLRWMNYLRPSVKRGHIAPDEEDLILRLHRLLGNRWSLIAGRIPGRTDNEIKNYWNTHLSKKLISQGIDPRTHKPLTTPPDNADDKIKDKDKDKPSSSSSSSKKHQYHDQVTNIPGQEDANNNNNIGYLDGNSALGHGYMSLLNNEATGPGGMELMMRRNSNHHQKLMTGGDNDEEHEDMNNYSTDDVFSSFLNSLIDEEAFASHQSQQHNRIGAAVSASDPLVGSAYGWDSAVTDHNKISE